MPRLDRHTVVFRYDVAELVYVMIVTCQLVQSGWLTAQAQGHVDQACRREYTAAGDALKRSIHIIWESDMDHVWELWQSPVMF